MFDQVVLLWSVTFILVHLLQVGRKAILTMAINTNSPSPPHFPWKRVVELPALLAPKRLKDVFYGSVEDLLPSSLTRLSGGYAEEDAAAAVARRPDDLVSLTRPRGDCDEKVISGSMRGECMGENDHGEGGAQEQPLDSLGKGKAKMSRMARKRPACIVIPESSASLGFCDAGKEEQVEREFEVEGSEYCLVSRKGRRHAMEDGYQVITNINGDSKQAFFGVFDGHGGRAAVDFVSGKLGKNILAALAELEKEENPLERAIKAGYLTTDKEFISKGVASGTCAATAVLKDGELHVANVGDCRVVMSRNGVAHALTSDHGPSRQDERTRIESLGGYVNCRNGVWRIQDSLAVSRAIGDASMKEWIISEPETKKLRLMPDCEFLIIASDGLWDKVTNQEAVDIVSSHKSCLQSCKDLAEISSGRGSRDDITVMIVDLQKFVQVAG